MRWTPPGWPPCPSPRCSAPGRPAQRPAHGANARACPTLTQQALLEAITYCTSQIPSAGFAPNPPAHERTGPHCQPFHALAADVHALRVGSSATATARASRWNTRASISASSSMPAATPPPPPTPHLDAHGISVDLVFACASCASVCCASAPCWTACWANHLALHTARLLAHLAKVGQYQRSLRALVANSTSPLAAKVAERSAETGEHYITRTRAEYRAMLGGAGGALTAITTSSSSRWRAGACRRSGLASGPARPTPPALC